MTELIAPETPLAEIAPDLAEAGWSRIGDAGAIAKSFRFRGFPEAFAFMTRVAFAAEAANHHPDWRNVWNRVEVELSTHDAGGLTEKDIALARAMEAL
ncbi:4a-hydroxytetrahydrobiopterin dehydratase [Mangrovicoccus sp. HB161399]|uniref:4a-hydroxytetrahydrobiopterin dehydratase n=1 Tax=Mangrovicoccus sp. HB161399 TaxID=2720392 RepID=UPI0015567C16|nr:4a-hydroxytetrahydrobiopterin dehydratase [Mangrovicoccus sp. HB161399]